MMLRIYFFLRVSTRLTKWRNENSSLLCNFCGIEADPEFAIKCLMEEKPHLVLLCQCTISVFFFACSIMIFELPLYEDFEVGGVPKDDSSYQDYRYW